MEAQGSSYHHIARTELVDDPEVAADDVVLTPSGTTSQGALHCMKALGLVSLLVTCSLTFRSQISTQRTPTKGELEGVISLPTHYSIIDVLRDHFDDAEKAVEETDPRNVEKELEEFKKESMSKETGKYLLPKEHMHDGNLCADDEELFASLCYKKCALFDKLYPIRTGAFSCCMEQPCGAFNSKFSFSLGFRS